LLFGARADSKVNTVEKHSQADLHKLGQKTGMNFRKAYMEFQVFNKHGS
jgi:hypothetical protein